MRLKLLLRSQRVEKLSINYNYSLSSAIYKLLKLGSPEFASFLHSIGYKLRNKTYKLFTFALKLQYNSIEKDYFVLNAADNFLYVSSPLIDDFIKNFLIGTFEDQKIELYSNYIKSEFFIQQVEALPLPQFITSMHFLLHSPMVLSTYKDFNAKTHQYFLRNTDDSDTLNRVFNQNLINKYEAIYQTVYNGSGVIFKWDKNYIEHSEAKRKRVTKKVSITKDLNNPIDIIGVQAPFFVEGDTNLIKIGYECGFGEKNPMGFGMVEEITS
jgi:CRISPR-associated endoribonuclease Cas6